MTELRFEAIGTSWQIDIYQDISIDQKNNVLLHVTERIEAFDKTYSRFRSDSLVTQISKQSGEFTFPADAQRLFAVYYDIYKRTGGLVTPLIGNVISDAGYDASYSLVQKNTLQSPRAWDEVMMYTHPLLSTRYPVLLDFGAGGKGYLIDIVSVVLEELGVHTYCIDAGGDILYKNTEPIRIGLENPDDTSQVIGVYTLSGGSICGSAGNRRAWGDFTHIINPKTLVSPDTISAVWVVAKEAFIADILATCLFFTTTELLRTVYSFEYCIVYSDHSIEKSVGFKAEVFTQ